MLHRASIVPTTLTLAVAVSACQISPGTTSTSDTDNATFTGNGDEDDSTGGTTSDDTTPTSSEPTSTSNGPTDPTQTTPGSDTTDPTTQGGDDTTIFDVQKGDIPIDAVVTIKGVVITTQMKLDGTKGAVFVEEPEGGEYSGIQLYLYDEVAAAWDAPPGTIVDLVGTYTEFYDNSQLTIKSPADITVVGPGELPAPALVASADVANGGALAENYEGVVVQLTDAVVTKIGADAGIGQFEVDDSALVSDYFLFPDTPVKPAVGDIFSKIAGPLLYSFDQFKVAPRTLDDIVGAGDTTDTDTDTDTDTTDSTTGGDTTIFDIQKGEVPLGDVVTIQGVIATTGLTFKKDGFFVEDPAGGQYSGIYVYVSTLAVVVKPGDVLTITGEYDEFYDNSQIKVANLADIVVTGTAALPAPEVVTPADVATAGPLSENYEGVLVQVKNVSVTEAVDMFGEFEVDNILRVDDLFVAKVDWVNPKVADKYTSITGPMAFSFETFKISPATAADVKK